MAFLDDKVAEAIAAINALFPSIEGGTGHAGFYIHNPRLETLVHIYESHLDVNAIIGSFESCADTINSMRSPHLPTDMFEPSPALTLGGKPDAIHFIEDDLREKESYENAFMRMLGMPMDTDLDGATNASANSIYAIDQSQKEGTTLTVGYPYVVDNILDIRQNHEAREAESKEIFLRFFNVNELSIGGHNYTDDNVAKVIQVRERYEQLTTDLAGITGTDPPDETRRAAYRSDLEGMLSELSTSEKALYDSLFASGVQVVEGSILDDIKGLYTDSGDKSAVPDVVNYINEKISGYKLTNLDQNFFRLKRLMLPPVQDARISSCISDNEKLVARPFSHPLSRVINGEGTRSSLLETVIRIRFDRASGTGAFLGSSATQEVEGSARSSGGLLGSTVGASGASDAAAVGLSNESFGALEALLVVRLRAAVQAFARKYKEVTEEVIMLLTVSDIVVDSGQSAAGELRANAPAKLGPNEGVDAAAVADARKIYEQQKLLEESVLTLFGETDAIPGLSSTVRNTDNVLDLQAGTVRNSGITRGHLVSPILAVASLPLKTINSRLASLETSVREQSGEVADAIGGLQTILGLPNGVGALDVAVYTLALFTMPEVNLLGLLDQKSFDLLMNGPNRLLYAAALGGDTRAIKPSTTSSVNTLTQIVIDGYELFRKELEKDD
tara:strand:+ start:51172 stop:53187 length:2016 start_codon:yes stop_codon:yes gene_type:complete